MKSLRCPHKLHGILLNAETIEFSCDSRWCGARKGIVVKHKFNLATGELIETNKFKNVERNNKNASS